VGIEKVWCQFCEKCMPFNVAAFRKGENDVMIL
jgi:hypothetical protein